MEKFFWPLIVLISLPLILLDQLVKRWAELELPPGEVREFLGPLDLFLVYNPDFAFGLSLVPEVLKIPLVVTSLVVWLLLLFFLSRNLWVIVSGALILSGGLSNLYDRLLNGYIIDYLMLPSWPVFNLADTWVTIGFVVFLVYLFFLSPKEVFRRL